MALLRGICVLKPPHDAFERIAQDGFVVIDRVRLPGTGDLWIDYRGSDHDDLFEVARMLSGALATTTFAFLGQRAADCIGVCEADAGRLVSTVTFGDDGWTVEPSSTRPWHEELGAGAESGSFDSFERLQAFMETFFESSGSFASCRKKGWFARTFGQAHHPARRMFA